MPILLFSGWQFLLGIIASWKRFFKENSDSKGGGPLQELQNFSSDFTWLGSGFAVLGLDFEVWGLGFDLLGLGFEV